MSLDTSTLSDLQRNALRIALTHLDCDWDLDCLTNELLVEHNSLFADHRRPMTPQFLEQHRESMLEQYLSLCQAMGWDADEKLSWYEDQQRGPIEFRDLLGFRQVYPGRFFDREAIGLEACDAGYAEVADAIQELVSLGLVAEVGKLGFVMTSQGIEIARQLFPQVIPQQRGNPFQPIDRESLEAIAEQRRQNESH